MINKDCLKQRSSDTRTFSAVRFVLDFLFELLTDKYMLWSDQTGAITLMTLVIKFLGHSSSSLIETGLASTPKSSYNDLALYPIDVLDTL